MDDRRWDDLDLLLLAVQRGVLSDGQIEDCLRTWEEKRASAGADAPPLQDVAIEKGYLSQERLRSLVAEPPPPPKDGSTVIRAQVAMACPACRVEVTLSLESALRQPRCRNCSGALGVRKSGPSSKTPSVKTFSGPLPDDVRQAAEDPRNRFSHYVLLRKLGAGGMGEVFKGWDTVMARPVALKFPRSVGEEEIRRLTVEAQSAGRLSHPNIASVYELGEADGRVFIAMQYIDGRTAEDAIQAMGPRRDFREIARWLRDAALAAHYAHERGIIHRDLKPVNLMVDGEGRLYVMDFGLAKLHSGAGTGTISGMILGTPSFMPPEQASGNAPEIDRRSDVYALGTSLYVMLSGRKPFDGETVTDILIKIITTDPPPLRQAEPAAPKELEAIVEKAMRRSKDQRYSTAKDLADDLTRWLQGETVRARRSTVSYRMGNRLRRFKAQLLTAGVCLLLGAGGFAAYLLTRPPDTTAETLRLKEWSRLFGEIQEVLPVGRFKPAEAAALLERASRDFPDQKADVDRLVERQHDALRNRLAALPRDRWLAEREQVAREREWLAFLKRPTGAADRILAWRGTCSLTIHVHPDAVVAAPFLAGLAEEDRAVPLTLPALEIVDGSLELSRRDPPARKVVPLAGLENGRRYRIEGTWDDPASIALREVK